MPEHFADRTAALLRLRRAQARVVDRIAPDIAREVAKATPSVHMLEGVAGGKHLVQRVQVERLGAPFDASQCAAAAAEEYDARGDGARRQVSKADGGLRFDVGFAGGDYHSVTVLHGGRVLQLTSFSEELGVPAEAGEESVDAFGADTLVQPPEVSVDERARAASGDVDPRPAALDDEERRLGPEYGYVLALSGR